MKVFFDRLAKKVVPWLVCKIITLWFMTCRVKVHNSEYKGDIVSRGDNAIGVFWHYSIIFVLYHLRNDSAAVMVSASKDGDYLAGLAKILGFVPIRGSRNRRGRGALKEMLDAVGSGSNAGIVGDGSKGPVKKLQMGPVYIASKTKTPLLPMAWSASRYISFNSWDKTALPLPFSKVDFYYGESFVVPPDLAQEELEVWRQKFEDNLQDLYTRAWQKYDRVEH